MKEIDHQQWERVHLYALILPLSVLIWEQAAWRYGEHKSADLCNFSQSNGFLKRACLTFAVFPDRQIQTVILMKAAVYTGPVPLLIFFWQHKGDTSAPGAEMLPNTSENEVFCKGSLARCKGRTGWHAGCACTRRSWHVWRKLTSSVSFRPGYTKYFLLSAQ